MSDNNSAYLNEVVTNAMATVLQPIGDSWFHEANSGTVFIKIPLAVEVPGSANHKKATAVLYLTEKTEENTMKTLLEVFGVDNLLELRSNKQTLEGKSCKVTSEFERGQDGKTYCKIKWVNSVNWSGSNGSKTVADPKKLETMLARLNKKHKVLVAKAGKKAPVTSPAEAQAEEEELFN